MSLDEFLAWEDRQPLRYEFDGVQPIAMTGGTWAHSAIQRNLAIALETRLRGKPCQFHGNDLKIMVAGSIRYPDGFVTCTPGSSGDKIARDPVVIFEVLSDSTAGVDTVVKNREYAATPSIRRYVLLAQDVMGGTMFDRVGDDWVGHVLGPESLLPMPEIGVDVPIAESMTAWSWRRRRSKTSHPGEYREATSQPVDIRTIREVATFPGTPDPPAHRHTKRGVSGPKAV